MPLTLGAFDGTAGTYKAGNMSYAALFDVVHTEMFWGLEQHLFEIWILKPTAHVNTGRLSTVRTTAWKDAVIVALEGELLSSSSNAAREPKLVTEWLKRPWMNKWIEHVFVNAATGVLLVSYSYARLTRYYSFAKYDMFIRLSSVSLLMSSHTNEIFSISQLLSF
jgi:hypothetical protein